VLSIFPVVRGLLLRDSRCDCLCGRPFSVGPLGGNAGRTGRASICREWGCPTSFLLTAFYVDNGKSLPFWKDLPPISLWFIPGAGGLPVLVYALLRHPLARVGAQRASDPH